jgi:restriction system protein
MTRRRRGPVEELFGYFIQLPFWVAILGASFLYLFLRFGPPLLAGTSLSGKALAPVGPMIAPWVALAILAAGMLGVGKRLWRRFLLSRAVGVQALRQMSWPDFEVLVGEAFRRQGYFVTEHGGRQADGGIDLELVRGNERVIVQCKHWLNRQVPVQRVRELLGVVTAEGADRGILVATGGFTRDAFEFAAGKPLQLLDGEALVKLTRPTPAPIPAESPQVQTEPPSCPICEKPMVLRTARRGWSAGSRFWGCRAYPDCRGTRAA